MINAIIFYSFVIISIKQQSMTCYFPDSSSWPKIFLPYLTLKMQRFFFFKAAIDYFCIPDNTLCLPPTFAEAIVFKRSLPIFFFFGGGGRGKGWAKRVNCRRFVNREWARAHIHFPLVLVFFICFGVNQANLHKWFLIGMHGERHNFTFLAAFMLSRDAKFRVSVIRNRAVLV